MPWLRYIFYVLIVASCLSSAYLYNYAAFKGCRFPSPDKRSLSFTERLLSTPNQQAPFRLLAFGDPQLEGDTSIAYKAQRDRQSARSDADSRFSGELTSILSEAVNDFFKYGFIVTLQALRKRIDLIGNDYYLAHIYRTLHSQTNPTHVTVLGDLLGSQWINDAEFDRRAGRYWNRVFQNGLRIEDSITSDPTMEILEDDSAWKRRIINIAGNHDVGYAGDLTPERMTRFERSFGAANWEIVFEVPYKGVESAYLRLVILNSMVLDTPALNEDIQRQTYEFLNDVIVRSEPVENRSVGTVLLTHIPLHKQEGVCTDAPYFSFGSGGRLREQNHLSEHVSKSLLEGIFGLSGNSDAPLKGFGRQGIILNGHDHEGCDVWHHLPKALPEQDWNSRAWNATRYEDSDVLRQALTSQESDQRIPGLREITLRSMMGEYGGWGYMISGWIDPNTNEWTFEAERCSIGIQHVWWAVHILLLMTAGSGAVLVVLASTSLLKPDVLAKRTYPSHKKIPSITLNTPVEEDLENSPAIAYKKTPSIDIAAANDGDQLVRPKIPISRPPSPFDHFHDQMQMSGGRPRRRKPGDTK